MRSENIDITLDILRREEVTRHIEVNTAIRQRRLIGDKAIGHTPLIRKDYLAQRLQAVEDARLRATNDKHTLLRDGHLVTLGVYAAVGTHLDALAMPTHLHGALHIEV